MDKLLDILKDFYPAYLLFLAILVIGLVVLYYYPNASDVTSPLVASISTPVGSITSIFVNSDLHMYIEETSGFILGLVFLILSNAFLKSEERRRRAIIFTVLSFVLGALATFVWIFLPNQSHYSFGSSSVSYTQLGIVLGFTLINLHFFIRREGLGGILAFAFNFAIALVVIIEIMLQPALIFNIASGVNSLVHEIGFLFGFLATFIYWAVIKYQNRIK